MKGTIMITVRDLKHYSLLQKEIIRQKKYIDRLREENGVGDRVAGSSSVFPYEPRHFTVSAPTNQTKIVLAEKELERLLLIKREILELLNDTFGTDRQILEFTMRGQSQAQIAQKLGINQSSISRRLQRLCG